MTIAIHAVQAAALTGGGPTQSFTKASAGTCVGAMFFVGQTSFADVTQTNAALSVGACDGTRQYAHSAFVTDGSSNTACNRRGVTDKCIHIATAEGVVEGEAAFDAFVTDGVRVSWSDFPDGDYPVLAWLFFDSAADLTFYCNTATADGPDTTVTSIEGPGAQPDVVIATAHGSEFNDTVQHDLAFIMGFACRKSPIQQACLDIFSNDNDTITKNGGAVSDERLLYHASHGGYSRGIEVTSFDSLGFNVTHRAGSSSSDLDFGYVTLAFNSANDYWCGVVDAPVATGDWPIFGSAMFPLSVLMLPNMHDTIDSFEGGELAGAFGVSLFTATDEHYVSIAVEDNVIPMDTQTLTSSARAVGLTDHGGVLANGFQSSDSTAPVFHDTGFTLSFSTVGPSTKRKWPVLVIEDPGASPAPPPPSPTQRSFTPGVIG